MKHVFKDKLKPIILACIFASILFCNGTAQAVQKIIDAHIVMDTQLGTTKIEEDATANAHIMIDGLQDNPNQTAAGAKFTYSWSLTTTGLPVTLPDANARSNTLSTSFDTAGAYPINFKVDIDFVSGTDDDTWHGEATGEVTQKVIGGDFTTIGDKILYYFCGAPVGVGDPQTVSVPQQPQETTITWNTSASLTVTTAGEIKGVAPSVGANPQQDWIQVVYSLNGVSWTSRKHDGYTVRKPDHLYKCDYKTGFNNNAGRGDYYYSEIIWGVIDQFNIPFPNGVPYHEEFGVFTPATAYPNENWGSPSASHDSTATIMVYPTGGNPYPAVGAFRDKFWIFTITNGVTITPTIDPYSHDLVQSAPQSYYIGSPNHGEGCSVTPGTLKYYLDRADHE